MPRTGQPALRHVASVERALTVLDALAEDGTELGTNEIARRTKINASTVSRLLATLTSRGYVEHAPETGRYRLGLRLLDLGNAVLGRLDLREVARPYLAALVETTGETATLSAPTEHDAVTVDFVQSAASVVSVARLGRPSVGHATATGKVALAFGAAVLPPGSLTAYTSRTLTDRDAVESELALVREQGWARATGEREEDLNGIAVPIGGRGNELAGILGLQGPSSRFDESAMNSTLPLLVDAAAAISKALGPLPK